MAEELQELEEKTLAAIKWVSAEFKYANDLKEILDKVEKEGAEEAVKDLRKAFQALRYMGRCEYKAEKEEKEILEALKEIEKILPENWKKIDQELVTELDVARGKLVKLASRFTGKLSGELKKIRKEELTIEHFEDKKNTDPEMIDKLKAELVSLLNTAEGEIEELIKWIGGTEAILEKIEEGFVKKLKEIAA
jgi:DNA-directed RNA polymerase subunit F